MLTTHLPAKRGFSNVDFDSFDFNLSLFHSTPFISSHSTPELDLSAIGSPYKRSRLNQTHHLAKQWSWSRTAAADVQHQFSAKAIPSSSIKPLTFLPDNLAHAEAKKDKCNDKEGPCFLPYAFVCSPSRDMPAERPALSSNAGTGKQKVLGTSRLEEPRSTKFGTSRPNNNAHSASSRRRAPVPGENHPRLAATWRETTSSRGADNPISARSQGRAPIYDVPISRTNVSSSSVATDGLEPPPNFCSSSVSQVDPTEEQHTLYSTRRPPRSDAELYHDANAFIQYNGSDDVGIGFGLPFIHQTLHLPSEMTNHYLELPDPSFGFAELFSEPEPMTDTSEANPTSNTCALVSNLLDNAFAYNPASTTQTAPSADYWDAKLLDQDFNWDWGHNFIQRTNNEEVASIRFPSSSIVATRTGNYLDTSSTSMERENMHTETPGIDCKCIFYTSNPFRL